MTMATMRQTGYILAALAAALLLTGCFHKMHELRPSEYGPGVAVGYVAPVLRWELDEDASTPVHDLLLVFQGTGTSYSRQFAGVEDLSRELQQLPIGEYDLLVTTNMTEAAGFQFSGLPATKADAGDVTVSLRDPASSPGQAWFGVSHFSVTEDGITLPELTLQRLLCRLTVHLTDVPAGSQVVVSLNNVARSVALMALDARGHYGLPGTQTVGDLVPGTNPTTLFPTVSGQERCFFTLSVTLADGTPLSVLCDAPRMECGMSYTLELDFAHLRPYMYLSSISISPWEEGWTVSGEILNPQD